MNTNDILKQAMATVRRALKAKGFSAKADTFYRATVDRNTVLVQTQRSVKSSAALTLVTVNYGVYSRRIGVATEDEPTSRDVSDTHWRKRITESGRERWIPITSEMRPEECASSLLSVFEEVLAELDARSSDESLRDEWLAGRSPGIVDTQRLLFLSILLHEIGPGERLPAALEQLRSAVAGTIHEAPVERALLRAGVTIDLPTT